jgi:hypothetical protein
MTICFKDPAVLRCAGPAYRTPQRVARPEVGLWMALARSLKSPAVRLPGLRRGRPHATNVVSPLNAARRDADRRIARIDVVTV